MLLLGKEILLVSLEGFFHRILNVNILKASVRVMLVWSEEVRVVSRDVLIRDSSLHSVVVQFRIHITVFLPGRLVLVSCQGQMGLELTLKLAFKLFLLICKLFPVGEREEIQLILLIITPLLIVLLLLYFLLI